MPRPPMWVSVKGVNKFSKGSFHELKKIGLEAFLNLNDGEGWMRPETLKLADYRLGHDNRAFEPQPVAARLG